MSQVNATQVNETQVNATQVNHDVIMSAIARGVYSQLPDDVSSPQSSQLVIDTAEELTADNLTGRFFRVETEEEFADRLANYVAAQGVSQEDAYNALSGNGYDLPHLTAKTLHVAAKAHDKVLGVIRGTFWTAYYGYEYSDASVKDRIAATRATWPYNDCSKSPKTAVQSNKECGYLTWDVVGNMQIRVGRKKPARSIDFPVPEKWKSGHVLMHFVEALEEAGVKLDSSRSGSSALDKLWVVDPDTGDVTSYTLADAVIATLGMRRPKADFKNWHYVGYVVKNRKKRKVTEVESAEKNRERTDLETFFESLKGRVGGLVSGGLACIRATEGPADLRRGLGSVVLKELVVKELVAMLEEVAPSPTDKTFAAEIKELFT